MIEEIGRTQDVTGLLAKGWGMDRNEVLDYARAVLDAIESSNPS
jgi:hypothetical protein